MLPLRMLSVLLILGLVYGCDDIRNPFVNDYERAKQLYKAGNWQAAFKWFSKAAEQGHANAQAVLGSMYANGEGVDEDDKQAVYWFTKAAEQGRASAQVLLGTMFDNGEGVAEDDKQAVYWYTKAAEQGHATAQFNLGLNYAIGEGVAEDDVKAHMWYNIAAANGNEGARALKDILVETMSPSLIAKAQEMARDCVAKNYKGC